MRTPRILIVDDQAVSRTLLREMLAPLNYEVQEAADGVEALDAVAAHEPDLVLLDVQMPKRDGHSVCRQLKSDDRTRLIPVVMVTSLDQLSDRLQGLDAGADDYLIKPFYHAELLARVRSALSLKSYTDELEHASRVLEGIALTIDLRDGYTSDHCKRVGAMAACIGAAFDLPDEELKTLRMAGKFHDIGKIAIPDAILRKPGRLTVDEMELMKTHPAIGAQLLQPMRTMQAVLPLIHFHHERLDGSGYPAGLSASQIPLTVRILSVSDIFDALMSPRSYRDPMPLEKGLSILREESAKGWWDREVVETLVRSSEVGNVLHRP